MIDICVMTNSMRRRIIFVFEVHFQIRALSREGGIQREGMGNFLTAQVSHDSLTSKAAPSNHQRQFDNQVYH